MDTGHWTLDTGDNTGHWDFLVQVKRRIAQYISKAEHIGKVFQS